MSAWSDSTIKVTRGVWGLAVGTVLLWRATEFVPEVLKGGLERDELYLLVLFVFAGVLLAAPHLTFQAIGRGVEAYQQWRKKD